MLRVVRMNGLDLSRFQFDYDQTWAVLFLGPDGTVYGRYGTRAGGGEQSTSHLSLAGLKNAMRRALAVHASYPANRDELRGKQPHRLPFRYPEDVPWLARRTRHGDVRQSCVHCHMVAASLIRYRWERGELREQDIFVYPLPENVGMQMDPEDDVRVRSVRPGSPAHKAGIRSGDYLVRIAGQPLVSQADIQWVLHHARDGEELEVELYREGDLVRTHLGHPHGHWRRGNIHWRASTWHLRPGMRVEALAEEQRRRLRIPPGKMALEVRMVLRFDDRARRAGVRRGDVIIRVADRDDLLTEEDFLAYLWLHYGPGQQVPLTVLRGGRQVRAILTMRWHPPD